jgi:hypothetical protein
MGRRVEILKNPFFCVLPLIVILWTVWSGYNRAAGEVKLPTENILANSLLTKRDGNGLPLGWQLTKAGSLSYAIGRAPGHNGQKSPLFQISNYKSGSMTLGSPTAPMRPGTTYLYKGLYKSALPFELVKRFSYADGSSTSQTVAHYPVSREWTTVADAFKAPPKAVSAQYLYTTAGNGTIQLDANYLAQNAKDVYIRPAPVIAASNEVTLPTLSGEGMTPDGWGTYSAGRNQVAFDYVTTDGDPYLRTHVDGFRSGEAKWEYEPLPVTPGQSYAFNVSYRSDAPADVIAEYMLASGKRQFETVTTLTPSNDWTTYSGKYEIPRDATSMLVTTVLHTNGTLDTKQYAIHNVSKAGSAYWQRPLASITFDDGWASAYDNGAHILGKFGYRGTFYLNPSSIDTPNHFATSRQVTELEKQGHEMASHGYEHLDFTTLAPQDLNYQLGHAEKYFSQVLKEKQTDFATPYGNSDPQVEYTARKYYASMRSTTSGINTRQNFDPYNLLVLYVGATTPISVVENTLKQTQADHGWVILVYHRVETGIAGETAVKPDVFQQQMASIKKSGIPVETVSAALKEVGGQQ